MRCWFDECLHLKRRVGRRTMPILLARSSVKVMPAANAADRSSRNLAAARPVASRLRCRESVSRSHQAPAPMELLIGAPRGSQQKPQAWVGDDVGGGEVPACHLDGARWDVSSRRIAFPLRLPKCFVVSPCSRRNCRHLPTPSGPPEPSSRWDLPA
jgi:hypothetical protein